MRIGSTVILRDGPGSEPEISLRRVGVGWGDIGCLLTNGVLLRDGRPRSMGERGGSHIDTQHRLALAGPVGRRLARLTI
jgi:hypothetical protein